MAERPERKDIMLAYPADEGRVYRLNHKGVILSQPKYNGERCRIEWFHGEPVLISSYGNEFLFLDHIKAKLLELPPYLQYPFDGELYHHGWSRQKIHSIVSRKTNKHPDVEGIEFHLFDTQDEEKFQLLRIADCEAAKSFWSNCDFMQLVPTVGIKYEDWPKMAGEYIEQGYEGAIFRNVFAKYVRKRNVSLIKFKPTETDEYTILEVLEAISKEGEPKGMAGAFMVADPEGRVFRVGAGKMKHPERIDIWNKRKEVIGHILVVKHELIANESGIPVSAVAIKIK
jgi:ATP-dependent DNA ligase